MNFERFDVAKLNSELYHKYQRYDPRHKRADDYGYVHYLAPLGYSSVDLGGRGDLFQPQYGRLRGYTLKWLRKLKAVKNNG